MFRCVVKVAVGVLIVVRMPDSVILAVRVVSRCVVTSGVKEIVVVLIVLEGVVAREDVWRFQGGMVCGVVLNVEVCLFHGRRVVPVVGVLMIVVDFGVVALDKLAVVVDGVVRGVVGVVVLVIVDELVLEAVGVLR